LRTPWSTIAALRPFASLRKAAAASTLQSGILGLVASAALALCAAAPAPATAQALATWTPKPGSPERKAIMDGLRITAERRLHQKVIFVVNHLKVEGNWAFTITIPKNPNGGPVDWQKTSYRSLVKPGHETGVAFSGEVVGLLRKRAGHWRTVDYCIGPSDVCWVGWDRKYGAPSPIFKVN
jgi:hypothetical protein